LTSGRISGVGVALLVVTTGDGEVGVVLVDVSGKAIYVIYDTGGASEVITSVLNRPK
jgi:hypothetical protein